MDLSTLADPQTLTVLAVFLLAGFVKGVVGMGLPTVALGLLSAVTGLSGAMALLLAPSFATNVWQALSGPGTGPLCRRIAPMLIAAVLLTWVGMAVFVRVDAAWMSMLLGALILGYGAWGLASPRLPRVGRREPWLGPLAGAVNGLLTGMTGSFVVPGVFYLQALGLDRNAFVKAMAMLFTVSTLALGTALWGQGRMPADLGWLSVAACVPAFVGMAVGARVRHALSEQTFRRVFFVSLVLLGGYIVVRVLAG